MKLSRILETARDQSVADFATVGKRGFGDSNSCAYSISLRRAGVIS